MKIIRGTLWLLMASFGVQEQKVEASNQTPGDLSQQLDNLQIQLRRLDMELNSIREEVTTISSLKAEKKRELLEQVNHRGDQLACLKTERASIEQGAIGVSVPPLFPAFGKSRNWAFPGSTAWRRCSRNWRAGRRSPTNCNGRRPR